MQHVAIMKKEFKLLDKILLGQKDIESRWYVHKKSPWMKIAKGDDVYFKEGLVRAKAKVLDVKYISDLNEGFVKELILKYHKRLGVSKDYFYLVKNKKYGILIFLEKAESVLPFDIDKTGYGNMCSWISVTDVEKIKRK